METKELNFCESNGFSTTIAYIHSLRAYAIVKSRINTSHYVLRARYFLTGYSHNNILYRVALEIANYCSYRTSFYRNSQYSIIIH